MKGSRKVVEKLQQIISEKGLKDKVELSGTFCMGRCETGVSVTVDGEYFSVSPESVDDFFENVVAARIKYNAPDTLVYLNLKG